MFGSFTLRVVRASYPLPPAEIVLDPGSCFQSWTLRDGRWGVTGWVPGPSVLYFRPMSSEASHRVV